METKQKGIRSVPRAYAWGKRRYTLVKAGLEHRAAKKIIKEIKKTGTDARIKEYPSGWAVYQL